MPFDERSLGSMLTSAFLLGHALFRRSRMACRSFGRFLGLRPVLAWEFCVGICLHTYHRPSSPRKSNFGSSLPGRQCIPAWVRKRPAKPIMFPRLHQLYLAMGFPPTSVASRIGIIFAGVGLGAALTPGLISYLRVHYGWALVLLCRAPSSPDPRAHPCYFFRRANTRRGTCKCFARRACAHSAGRTTICNTAYGRIPLGGSITGEAISCGP